MDIQKIKENALESKAKRAEVYLNIENFQKVLNKAPDPKHLQDRAGKKYLPISYIQDKLDELFYGMWETHSFQDKIVGNEIRGTIILEYYHPVADRWMKRTGVAAVQIRMQRGAKPTEIDKKIINALELDAPHLLTDCIKNAAKSLGKAFGRDLNRDNISEYRPIITNVIRRLENGVLAEIQAFKTREGAIDWKQNNDHLFGDAEIAYAFNTKFKTLPE